MIAHQIRYWTLLCATPTFTTQTQTHTRIFQRPVLILSLLFAWVPQVILFPFDLQITILCVSHFPRTCYTVRQSPSNCRNNLTCEMKSIITWGCSVLMAGVFCLFFKGRFLCFEILLLSSNLPVKIVMYGTVQTAS